ncbi:cystatin-like protein [Drosophila gunungcola]|uniref:cystatin-like protein n=1 Tax=Drosophila gunungcola TaxID=103775 RepID=UPI0022E1F7E3|nr:cystatin-like protein [Drosophila gunungcola]
MAMSAENVVGGISQLKGDDRKEALQLLDDTLAHLAAGGGPKYKAVNVISVTGQVVAGTLNTFEVELDDGSVRKQCTVQIWTRPWMKKDGTNIKIKFSGEDEELDRTW